MEWNVIVKSCPCNNLGLPQDKGNDCVLLEKEDQARPHSNGQGCSEQAESFKFLGVHINNKLTWSKHTKTVVKRAQQNLFPSGD